MIEMNRERTIRCMTAGILGAALLACCDWMMIYGDPSYEGNLAWLTNGVLEIEPWRFSAAMALAFPAVILYAVALLGTGDIFRDERNRRTYMHLTLIGMTPWLCIHLFYCMILFIFRWLFTEGYEDAAYSGAEALCSQYIWMIPAGEALMILPFLYILWKTYRKRTVFRRRMAVNSPLTWYIVLKAVTMVLPDSAAVLAFTNGLMSEAMIIWFAIYIWRLRKNRDRRRQR